MCCLTSGFQRKFVWIQVEYNTNTRVFPEKPNDTPVRGIPGIDMSPNLGWKRHIVMMLDQIRLEEHTVLLLKKCMVFDWPWPCIQVQGVA